MRYYGLIINILLGSYILETNLGVVPDHNSVSLVEFSSFCLISTHSSSLSLNAESFQKSRSGVPPMYPQIICVSIACLVHFHPPTSKGLIQCSSAV